MRFQIFTKLKFLTRLVLGEPARVLRYSKFWISGRLYPRFKRTAVILCSSGGLGDELMLTAVAREVRKRNPDALIHVIARIPEVFDRNPYVNLVSRRPRESVPWLRPFMVRNSPGFPWHRHFLHCLCEKVNITDHIELRTYIFPDERDQAYADKVVSELGAAPILLARTSDSAQTFRKIWPLSSWQRLAGELINLAPVVDIGLSGMALDIPATGYRNLVGKTTIHQLAALMGRAKALITMDSGPNHLAAAYELPTVCLLGGVFPPVAIRYPRTKVLVNRPDCCDCWPLKACSRNLECLVNISVEDVLKALDEICPGIRTPGVDAKQLSQHVVAR